MSCQHDCEKPPVFPRAIHNRPGLQTIDYRIGTYADLRAYVLDRLDKSPGLQAWTHRGADDPGIALLEGAAIVGDILTFYQQLYANEAWLRTANWRETVAGLVQLLGYRLAPGVGGEARFAVAVKGDEPVTVPKGFGFKAQLKDQEQPVEFESVAETIACPHLSEFRLYAPRLPSRHINGGGGMNQLELQAVNEKNDPASLASVELKKGDRIMLVPDAKMYDVNGTAYSAQKKPELLIVSGVETALDRIVITFEGSLMIDRGQSVTAYVIDRSFGHFGANAPPMTTVFDSKRRSASQVATKFERRLDAERRLAPLEYSVPSTLREAKAPRYLRPYAAYATLGSVQAQYLQLAPMEMALDTEVDDLAVGSMLVCQGLVRFDDRKTPVPMTVVRQITEVRSDALVWGNLNGTTSIVSLDRQLIANIEIEDETADIRQLRFHEAVSPKLSLRALTNWPTGVFTDGRINYYGTLDEVKVLAGRSLLLVHDDGGLQPVRVGNKASEFSDTGRDNVSRWMWTVTLVESPVFTYEAFDETDPKVTVYGNIVETTQGKTGQQVVLGSGDHRQAFQTFPVPKTPLTYLLDETQTPAHVPELMVYVDGIRWQQVATFFNSGPDEPVYVVREDEEGKSWVQFGDGNTGARLPSGQNNVLAVFRTGVGAVGPLKPDSTPQATGKLEQLEKVYMPGSVVGGGDAESEDNARVAAPGKMQSLGRLVGLADFEAEARAIPGVRKARAYWGASEGVPQVELIVLTQSGGDEAAEKVRATMATYNRCRGPARFPINVVQGSRQYLYIKVSAGYQAGRREADMLTAIKAALGVTGEEGNGIDGAEGLFGLDARQFGEDAHVSQIIGVVQQVTGVTWVELDAAQSIETEAPGVTDPGTLDKPVSPVRNALLGCPRERILTLYTGHLNVALSRDERAEGCKS